jgi:hypothetical protein
MDEFYTKLHCVICFRPVKRLFAHHLAALFQFTLLYGDVHNQLLAYAEEINNLVRVFYMGKRRSFGNVIPNLFCNVNFRAIFNQSISWKNTFQIVATTDSSETQSRCQRYNELLFTKIAAASNDDVAENTCRSRLVVGLMKPEIIDQFCGQCSRPSNPAAAYSSDDEMLSWKCMKCATVFCNGCSLLNRACSVCEEGALA